MTTFFQPGDRVLINGLSISATDHRGTRGTVDKVQKMRMDDEYPADVVCDAEPNTTWCYKLSDLELVGNAKAEVGDRVVVRELSGVGPSTITDGRQGDVIAFTRAAGRDIFRVNVILPGWPSGLPFGVTELDKVTPVPEYPAATAAVGDHVAVIRTKDHNYEGRVGLVEWITEPVRIGNNVEPRVYGVAVPGVIDLVGATKVAALADADIDALQRPRPTPKPLADWELELLGYVKADTVTESDPHEGLDPIRVRALQAAPALLPYGNDDADVIRAAEFLVGPQFAELATVGSIEAPDLTEDLTVTDVDGDVVRFTCTPTPRDGDDAPVAVITRPDTGNAFEVYLSPLAVTQVRDYLAAAARVQAA